MRVFLDTNVLVAAFATRGLCADVVRLTLAEHELLVSPTVLQELTRALVGKLHVPEQTTHEVVTFKAALNHVGSSSLEVGVKVLTEVPWSGEVRHACTAYLTFVHLGTDLRPRPCPRFVPETSGERRRWAEAELRRAHRLERVKRLKASIQEGR